MAYRYHCSHFSRDSHSLLKQVSHTLDLSYNAILCRAVEHWLVYPRSPIPRSPRHENHRGIRVQANLSEPIGRLLEVHAIEKQTPVARLIEAAFLQWFNEIGGDLIYRLSIKKPSPVQPKPAPKPDPVPAADDEAIEILQQQLQHFQRTGNTLRVAQLRRELLQMGVAA